MTEAIATAPIENKIRLPKDIDNSFAVWMNTNNYSIGTIREYHTIIKRMIENRPPKKIGKRAPVVSKNHIKKNRFISPEKIKTFLNQKNTLLKRSSIRLFLVFLEDIHQIELPPFRYPRLKKSSKACTVLDKKSFDDIINHIDNEFKLFAKLMYLGALRVSEVVRIRSDSFNWYKWVENKEDYGELKIIKAKRNKERIVPIHPKLMEEVFQKIPKHDDGNLTRCLLFDFGFNKYMRRKKKKGFSSVAAEQRYVRKVVRNFQIKLAEASEKAIGKKIKTHTLRASRATHLDELGMPTSSIRDLLGHDNISTTSRYIINTPEKLKKAIKKVDNYQP